MGKIDVKNWRKEDIEKYLKKGIVEEFEKWDFPLEEGKNKWQLIDANSHMHMRYDALVKGVDTQYLRRIAHYNDNGQKRTFVSSHFQANPCTYKVVYVGTIGYIEHDTLYSRQMYVDEQNNYWVNELADDNISNEQETLINHLMRKNKTPSNIIRYIAGKSKSHSVSEQMQQMQKEYDSIVKLYATRPDMRSRGDAFVFEYEL